MGNEMSNERATQARSTLSAIEVMHDGGKTIAEACEIVGIPKYTYYRWNRKFHRNGNHMEQETMTPSEAGTMLATGMATVEEAKSKKQENLDKVAAVDALIATGESAYAACKQIDIKSSVYYYWKNKMKGLPGRNRTRVAQREKRTKEEAMALIHDFQKRGDMSAKEWSKRNGVNPTTIYTWIKRYGNAPMLEAREVREVSSAKSDELKQAKIENQRLRMIVSDLMLDRQALIEFSGRK